MVLVVGPEEELAYRARTLVVTAARATDPDVEVVTIEASLYMAGEVHQLTSPSLFSPARVVVAEAAHAMSDAFASDVVGYAGAPAADVCLVLEHEGGVRAKGVLDALRAAGAHEVVCGRLRTDEQRRRFVSEELAAAGVGAGPGVAQALVDAVGTDLRELVGAVAVLSADTLGVPADGEGGPRRPSVSIEDVERHHGGRREITGFAVVDAAMEGRLGAATTLLRHALITGTDPIPLVAALASSLRTLARVSTVRDLRPADAARELGVAPFQVDRARQQIRRWDPAGLARAIQAVADADEACKGGGRDPEYAVERAVYLVAAQASQR